jgi:tetratricopeptide (TPR) repeat protein
MDRHPRETTLGFVGIFCCLICLSGCQEQAAAPTKAPVANKPTSPSAHPLGRQVYDDVILAGHLFAAPPLPSADQQSPVHSADATKVAESLIEEAPEFGFARPQPRRLPPVDAIELPAATEAPERQPLGEELPLPPVAGEDDGGGYQTLPGNQPTIRRLPPVVPKSPTLPFTRAPVVPHPTMSGGVSWPADAASVTADQGPPLGTHDKTGAQREMPVPQVLQVRPADDQASPATMSERESQPPSGHLGRADDQALVTDVLITENVTDAASESLTPMAQEDSPHDAAMIGPTDDDAVQPPVVLRRLPAVEVTDSQDVSSSRPISLLPPEIESKPADTRRSELDQSEGQVPATPESAPSPADSAPPAPRNTTPAMPSSFPAAVEPNVAQSEPGQHADSWTPVEVPVQPHEKTGSSRWQEGRAPSPVVTRQVQAIVQQANRLASRGAYFAARAEMIKAMRVATQASDTQQSVKTHSEALSRGMRALEEVEDFAPRGSRFEAEIDLKQVITAHRTPVLKDEELAELTPLEALQRYFTYAQQQLAKACLEVPATAGALYGLGRIYTVLDESSSTSQELNVPKAMALHQAALLVNPRNHQAANELGVLLARYGQLEDARRVLLHSISLQPEPEAWHNLAVVHERLGELELAHRARNEWRLALDHRNGRPRETETASPVRWVDVQEFTAARPTPGP